MSKITVVLVLLSGLVLGILAPIYAHASLIETSARDRSTGPFNPHLPAEAQSPRGALAGFARYGLLTASAGSQP